MKRNPCNCNCIECLNDHHGDCPWYCVRVFGQVDYE